jgi:cobalamin biosynthesis Mg chelatase CobN
MFPIPTSWLIAGAAYVALSAALGVQTWRLDRAQSAATKLQADWTRERVQLMDAAVTATTELRARETAQREKEMEATRASQKAIAQARADVDLARSAADRLHQRTEALAGRCAAPGPAADPSEGEGESPGRMLADMQRRLVEAAGRTAEWADQTLIDAQSCEAAWPQ